MQGLSTFKAKFADYSGNYVVIGGTACYILFDELGLDFRATKDIDMVVLMEEISHDFGDAFWQFINAGEYQEIAQGSHKNFYRFTKPKNLDYPAMIELFSRKPEGLELKTDAHTMPIHIDDDISSLSAILLNDEYYELLLSQKKVIDGISVLNELALIPFKIKAFLEIKDRQQKGIAEQNASYDLKKHRKDIFRLTTLISPTDKIFLSTDIKNDMQTFISGIRDEKVDLSQLGWKGDNAIDEFINLIEEAYQLKN